VTYGVGVTSRNQARHTHVRDGVTVGFFTDPTLCIGCKACEVACKEWNQVPDDGYRFTGESYDNTCELSGSTWRHVQFHELDRSRGRQVAGPMTELFQGADPEDPFSWLFLSDVCKHCGVAGCLESCPTGAIVRTEVGSVYIQDDVCNGCGYCVVSCPFGVADRRHEDLPGGGGVFKCTFCYDRQAEGLTPACAKACPTESILFGPLDELRETAGRRVRELRSAGYDDVSVYDPRDTSVGGLHAFFLILGEPGAYGLPPAPESPTIHLRGAWLSAAATSLLALAGTMAAFLLT
jgi:formate dehydrogenase iron-sulfur subunit